MVLFQNLMMFFTALAVGVSQLEEKCHLHTSLATKDGPQGVQGDSGQREGVRETILGAVAVSTLQFPALFTCQGFLPVLCPWVARCCASQAMETKMSVLASAGYPLEREAVHLV